jgi:hypothetical protein
MRFQNHKRERTSELVDCLRVTYGRNCDVGDEQVSEWQDGFDDEPVDQAYLIWLHGLTQDQRAWYLDGRGDGVQAEYKRIIGWLRSHNFGAVADSLDADRD